MLEQQALAAQSANIQGVSGASYTSAGFAAVAAVGAHAAGVPVIPAVQTLRDAPEGTWRYHHREEVMGTVVTFDLFCEGDVVRGQLYVRMARARALLQRADAVFSTWNEDSPISQLRRGEITVAQAPPEVAAVLEACEQARSLSQGWFDPWAMPGGLDPTGYVKGWAAQRALGTLVMPGVTGAIVNAAGDIASFGEAVRRQALQDRHRRPG